MCGLFLSASYTSLCCRTKKVFLGGLSLQTEERDIRDVLEPLGGLESVQIMTEKDSNKPRGFGFATFVDYDVVDKICLKKFIKIKVHTCCVRWVRACVNIHSATSRRFVVYDKSPGVYMLKKKNPRNLSHATSCSR